MVVLNNDQFYGNTLSIRLQTENISKTMTQIRNLWLQFAPEIEYRARFFDDHFADLYREERRTSIFFLVFTMFALFIACVGLFGLSAFMAERRTREIGIRKVLGAGNGGLLILLARHYLKWMVMANIAAWPVAYFLVRSWLDNFAYRTNLSVWIFLIAGFIASGLVLTTTSIHAVRVSRINPVHSLRCE